MGLCGSSENVRAEEKEEFQIKKKHTDDLFTVTKTLGDGMSCKVVVALDQRTRAEYALKILAKDSGSDSQETLFRNEVQLLRSLRHPNILEFVDAYEEPDTWNIVTRLCKGGELFDRVLEGKFSEKVASRLTKSMLQALAHCHSNSVVHRDIKPENFVFETKSEDSDMKLIDFGCALKARDDEIILDMAGSPYYVAPEVLDSHKQRTGKMWKASDMWSVGVIVFLLVHGYPPFNGENQEMIFKRIRRGRFRYNKNIPLSSQVQDLINKLLVTEPSGRLTAAQALKHPWIDDDSVAPTTLLPKAVVQGIQSFGQAIKLKKAVVQMMQGDLDQASMAQIQKMFKQYDVNGDGTLDADEVAALMSDIGMSTTATQKFIDQFDDDGDRKIDVDEFTAMKQVVDYDKNQRDPTTKNTAGDLTEVFDALDADHSGFLEAKEIADFLKVKKSDAEKMIQEVDANGNAKVDFREFVDLMKGHLQKQPAKAKLKKGRSKRKTGAGSKPRAKGTARNRSASKGKLKKRKSSARV